MSVVGFNLQLQPSISIFPKKKKKSQNSLIYVNVLVGFVGGCLSLVEFNLQLQPSTSNFKKKKKSQSSLICVSVIVGFVGGCMPVVGFNLQLQPSMSMHNIELTRM